jgi:hypothetical protein
MKNVNGKNMTMDFKFFKGTPPPKWRTYGGLMHPLETISTNYIKRIMKLLVTNGTLPNQKDGRTATEWYIILDNELKRRND